MEELKNLITDLRRQNVECRWFVPHQALYELMTETIVQKAIYDTKIEYYHIREIVQAVVNGGHKIFAILILIGQPESILKFVEDDHLQGSHLDHKLPFQLDKLQKLLSNLSAAKQFHEKQWEFTAPIFTGSVLPRVLEKEVILPFVESSEVGEGGFGVVHLIKVEPSHQEFSQASQHEVSCKFYVTMFPQV